MRKSLASISLTAALLGGGVAGAALFAPTLVTAQEADESPSDETTTDEAARPNKGDKLAEVLSPLVEDGTINQAQADAVITAIQEARPERDERPDGAKGFRGKGGFDPAAITEVLGITPEELRTAVSEGQSLADVAAANGVDPQAVVDVIVSGATAHIDEAVAAGKITAEEGEAKKAEVAERAEARVNGEAPDRGERPDRGQRGPRGPRSNAGAGAEDTTDA